MMCLFKANAIRILAEMRRYLLNLISSLFIFVIIFTLIAFGFKSFNQSGTETFRNTAVGYFVWIATLSSLTDLSWTIMGDMQRGMIEQVFISPFSPLLIYSVYEIVMNLFVFPIIYGIMVIIFKMAGMSLLVHPSFFYFLIMVMAQATGIGFILAGLTLKYKRTNALLNLAQFLVLGLLFLDVEGWAGALVPIQPHFLAMKIASEGTLPPVELFLTSTLGTVLYIAIGVWIFDVFLKITLKDGDLSMY